MILAGWYSHPADPDLECYWDGDEWTAKTRMRPLLTPREPIKHRPSVQVTREPVSSVVIAGYIAAVALPLLGFILGLTQINRSKDGLRIVILSIAFTLFWWRLLG